MPQHIDRSSPLPLYHQLETILREEIEGGVYRAGDLLPSEGDMCARYEVSRSVVRQTLANLARDGLVRSERGRGTFVAEAKLQERFVQRTRGFYDDLHDMGLPVSTRVLGDSVVSAPPEVRAFLGCGRALRIDRVRSVDGHVLTYVTAYLDPKRVPDLERRDLTDRSLYHVLEDDYGLRVGTGRRTVEAVGATDEIAAELGVETGTPLLLLRSASYDEDDEPLEYYEAWHRGDRTLFEIDIARHDARVGVRGRVHRGVLPEEPGVTAPRLPPAAGDGGPVPGVPVPSGRPDGGGMLETLRDRRVLAVLRARHYTDPAALAAGLSDGGVPLVEFTLTGDNALDAVAEASRVEGVIVGAGSVFTLADAEAALEAGAQFLVAPILALPVARAGLGVPVILAGLSPSEVWSAYGATGCPVKVFPASLGGPRHLRALAGPMPSVPLMPSGGVDVGNAADYLQAGAVAVNVGGSLCPAAALEAGDADTLRRNAAALREAIDAERA